jgi:aspartyl protease family protein
VNPFRRNGVLMLAIGWLLIIGIVWWAVDEWGRREANPNRALSAGPAGEVVLQRNRAGHFLADGEVNGRRVTFLLDTGATYIALPAQIARELKLKLGQQITLQTAAGPATGYPTRLDSVRLAGIEMRDMAAVVAEGLDPGQVLLGMNFLKRLEMTQRGEQLVLKPLEQPAVRQRPKD